MAEQKKDTTPSMVLHKKFLERYPFFKPLIGASVIILFLLSAYSIKQYTENKVGLSPTYSSASCYGLNCRPTLTVGGRVAPYGYGGNFSYGTLTVPTGSLIELTWFANNVDTCSAQGGWTDFSGVSLSPTVLPEPITKNRNFRVKCYKDGQPVISSSLRVVTTR